MKANVYVDGLNLYYEAVKNTPYRWLNVAAVCRLLLPRDQINQIKYFTALLRPRPHDPGQPTRQQTYIRALRTIPNLTIILGHFLTHEVMMPLAPPASGVVALRQVRQTDKVGYTGQEPVSAHTDGHSRQVFKTGVVVNERTPVRIILCNSPVTPL